MRAVKDHIVDGDQEQPQPRVNVVGNTGETPDHYWISWWGEGVDLRFQSEVVGGVTDEALLAIVIDRLNYGVHTLAKEYCQKALSVLNRSRVCGDRFVTAEAQV